MNSAVSSVAGVPFVMNPIKAEAACEPIAAAGSSSIVFVAMLLFLNGCLIHFRWHTAQA